MILDEHTACPACPQPVRDLYAVCRRVVAAGPGRLSLVELEELQHVLEALRPWIEAHHANQVHAFSLELEDARQPRLEVTPAAAPDIDHDGSER